MGWLKRVIHLSKPKKIILGVLAFLMVFNDIGRLASMMTDVVLLAAFIIVLAKGLEESNEPPKK